MVAVVVLVAWWGWQEYGRARTRWNLWDPNASATDRIRAVEAWADLGGEGVPELIRALESDDPRTRRYIVLALARLGPGAAPAIPALLQGLKDPVSDVRINSAIALTRINEGSPAIVDSVIGLLVDEDLSVRPAVIEALRDWSVEPLPAVVSLLDHESPVMRRSAVIILRRAVREDPRLADLVHRMTDDPDADVRAAARCAILGSGRATHDEFRQWLDDGNDEVILTAIDSLRRLGPDAQALIPNLVACLGRGDERIHFRVLRALRSFQLAAAPAIPAVFRFLESASPESIPEGLEVLVSAGAERELMVPLLRNLIQNRSSRVAAAAARLLEELDPVAARAEVAKLAESLRNEERMRFDAVFAALWAMGPDAAPAVYELIERLHDRDPQMRIRAVEVLRRLGPAAAPAVPEIDALLKDSRTTPGLTVALVEAAGAIGRPAEMIGPTLMELLISNAEFGAGRTRIDVEFSAPFRPRILMATARVGYRSPQFLAILRDSLSRPSPYDRMAAMEALAALSLKDRLLIPAFRRAMTDDDPSLRLTAIATSPEALGPCPEVISWLTLSLNDPHPMLRQAAAQALLRIGPAARSAVPALRAAVSDEENLRSATDQSGLNPVRPFAAADLPGERDRANVAETMRRTLEALAETRSAVNN